MRRPSSTVPTLTALILACLIGGAAHANPLAKYKPKSVEGKRHYKLGNKFLALKNYKLAIQTFKDGYLIDDAPIFLFNLAVVHREMGDLKASIDYYKRFLLFARDPHPAVRASIEKLIGQLGSKLAEQERETKARETARANDRKVVPPTSKNIDRKRGRTPIPAPWYADGVGWALTASGLVIAGVGVGLFANASSLRSEAEREVDFTKRQDLRDRADTRQTWGLVSTIAGGLALAAGIVKLAMHDSKIPGEKPGVDVAFGPGWIGLRGSF